MIYSKDTNHNSIAKLFMQFGWIVIDTSWSRGKLLDFFAYKVFGDFYFVEIKNGNKKLTDCEVDFIRQHPERSIVLTSIEAAQKWLLKR